MPSSSARPPGTRRAQSREIVALRKLGDEHPELAEAVDLQVDLLELQQRIQGRLPHPDVELAPDWLRQRIADGRPVLQFAALALDWTEFRLLVRQATDLLCRVEAVERADADEVQRLARHGRALEPMARRWYEGAHGTGSDTGADDASTPPVDPAAFDQILLVAMRPFLVRSAEAVLAGYDLGAWTQGYCPVCGGEPELALITRDARRLLVCGRCFARWGFDPMACPHCGNDDKTQITSFASRDRLYRIAACDVCQRYLKAYDARQTDRPLMIQVDTIATLPLDAAAMQRGYRG